MTEQQLWLFLPIGYLFSILVETPVLLVGLSARHPIGRRLFAGAWLTACTYPVVVLVLPSLIDPGDHRALYLIVAETFAAVAECALFVAAFGTGGDRRATARDVATVAAANLLSFGAGELLYALGAAKWLP
jgi:hypothetical protein